MERINTIDDVNYIIEDATAQYKCAEQNNDKHNMDFQKSKIIKEIFNILYELNMKIHPSTIRERKSRIWNRSTRYAKQILNGEDVNASTVFNDAVTRVTTKIIMNRIYGKTI